jgi:predicted ATP-dependent endonuclease of OLD family
MLIKELHVRNYRAIADAVLKCDPFTVLVGRNGAGKSSFLSALDAFYDIAYRPSIEDFHARECSLPIEISVTYHCLSDLEKNEFESFIRDEELIVTKRMALEDEKPSTAYYAAALQLPQFAEIRALAGDKRPAWRDLIASEVLPDLGPPTPKSSALVEQYMKAYESEHADLLQPLEKEETFFGAKNVGGGKLDKFTRFILVPAVRDAQDETSGKKGAIYQILDMIVLRKINAREDVQSFKSQFDERIRELYSSENLTELPQLGELLSETLEKYAPGSKLNLDWAEIRLPEIQPPDAKATLVEDDFEGEISNKGHGLQRALILTLLQHLAVTEPHSSSTNNDETSTNENEQDVTPDESTGPDLIIAIEEPELYLHPSRCRYMAEILQQLTSEQGMGLGAKNQVIFTTHSPYFINLDWFDRIRLVRKVSPSPSVVCQSRVSCFTLEQAKNRIAEACCRSSEEFTRDSFKAHTSPVLNTIVNEGFFADVVLLVEGASDVGIFWKLQEIMDTKWAKQGISVIPAGGTNNLDRPYVIFRGLGIPCYVIWDGDSHLIGTKNENQTIERNQRYLRMLGADVDDFPESQVQSNWAVFEETIENCIEHELSSQGVEVSSYMQEVSSEFGYDKSEQVLKNIEGAARLIDIIYEKGQRIAMLENIVERVTELSEI